jgi:hypothetical protein
MCTGKYPQPVSKNAPMYAQHCFSPDTCFVVPAGLSPTERHAVSVGRADAFRMGWDASLPTAAWRRALARLFTRVTGIEPLAPFADARLEALRLFACMIRRDDRRTDAQAARLVAAGFSPAALHQAVGLALA